MENEPHPPQNKSEDVSTAATATPATPIGPPGGVQPHTFRRPRSVDPDRIIPSPKFNKYFSDHSNSAQRTGKLWEWCAGLSGLAKELLVFYVYREYPPLLDPPEGIADEYKYIDKVLGTEGFESDKAFNDRYGAGDFKIYVDAADAPIGAPKRERTLAVAWVKGSRDFKSQPPSDKRITQIGADGWPVYIDRNDPQCQSYIEFLRSRGILPEKLQIEREKAKMAEATAQAAAAENNLVGKLTDKVLELASSGKPSASALESETIRNVIDASLSGAKASTEMLMGTIRTLQEQVTAKGAGGAQSSIDMLNIAVQIADKISKSNDPTPYLNMIAKLNETVVELQMAHLNDKIESLKSASQAQVQNPQPQGIGGLKGALEELRSAKDLLQELGLGGGEEAEPIRGPWWAQMVQSALPDLAKFGTQLLTMWMMQPRAPQPQPQPQPQAQAPYQPQPQPGPAMLQPAPQPQQPQPQAQPQQFTPAPMSAAPGPVAVPNPQPQTQSPANPADITMQLLGLIQFPLLNHIRDGQGGDDFADWFIGGFGEDAHQALSHQNEEMLLQVLYSSPVGSRLDGGDGERAIPREYVARFVHEFCTFNPDEYDKRKEREDRQTPAPGA